MRRRALTIFLVSSGVARLGRAERVLGQYRAFYENFSPGYGFAGIAMLANNNPIGIIFAATGGLPKVGSPCNTNRPGFISPATPTTISRHEINPVWLRNAQKRF
ncbi:hypothetical protein [Martelella endophytica]|uniref:Uncharacterized protein n=1 Tax=Martelella endophytica TaxID=1486262 RepID=A0A0D5LTK6_MAREN|nr:hypothetical protein [Martelella endophytica]AJY47315.1 hypothetical protein TM49_19230 [Martelella endophytica]